MSSSRGVDDPDLERAISGRRLRYWQTYVETCQLALGLGEWRTVLKIDRRPDIADALAQIGVTKYQHRAALMLAEDFFELEPEEQRHTIAHELGHLVTNPLVEWIWESQLKDILGLASMALVSSTIQGIEEHIVDRYASMLEAQLPIPDQDGQKEISDGGEKAADVPKGEELAHEESVGVGPEGRTVREEPGGGRQEERPIAEGGGRADARAEEERTGAEGEGTLDGGGQETGSRSSGEGRELGEGSVEAER